MAGEWTTSDLGELTTNFDGRRKPVKEPDRRPGPYPYYGASGVVDHVDGYLFDGEYLLVAEDGENLRTRQTPIAFMAKGKFWVNNHAHIVTGNEKADTRFLMYALQNADISGYLTGAVMPKLTQGNLNRIELSHPPLPEQRAIAHILGTLDDKIELNRRRNQTLEAMARALFKDWFVDFGPVRAKMEGRARQDGARSGQPRTPQASDLPWPGAEAGVGAQGEPYLPADLWQLFPDRLDDEGKPEGWRRSTIGSEVTVCGGSTPSTKEPAFWEGGEHHWATPKDLSELKFPVLLDTDRKITDAGIEKISSRLLPVGTVLLSSRAPIGYLAIAEVPTAINQGFIAMKCDGALPNVFILFWCHENMDVILGNANGSTFQEISKSNFRPIPVIVPPEPILIAFRERTAPIYCHIVENERESKALAQLRDTLLPKLISGELRIADTERFQEKHR